MTIYLSVIQILIILEPCTRCMGKEVDGDYNVEIWYFLYVSKFLVSPNDRVYRLRVCSFPKVLRNDDDKSSTGETYSQSGGDHYDGYSV